MAAQTRCNVPSGDSKSGAICTAAARTTRELLMARVRSDGPRVENERVALAMEQDDVEHVERIDRTDAFHQCAFAVAVQRLQRETARIHLAAFGDELLELLV